MYIVTGGAGYIGGHLVDYLISKNLEVIVIDDLSYGKYRNEKAKFVMFDLRQNMGELVEKLEKNPIIYHLAANPDVRTSMINVEEHFERDVKVTLNVMELARRVDAEKVIFTSSSTVYGETSKIPTPESEELKPISNYGLFKLLCENIVKYYAEQYGIKSISTRLANITGGRVSHGVVIDFIKKLKDNPNLLEILGNGKQRKSYLYIDDLIEAFVMLEKKVNRIYDVFNIGNNDSITVDEIAKIVIDEMKLSPRITYKNPTADGRGWPGDVRLMLLDISKISREVGWSPKMSSREVIRQAVKDLLYGYKSVY
ncbi:NAD-dependent epimerase/dehydratase family protein [Saccharolobus solfataricus]|uniref:UDP-glucose 4-epimerase (GalE-2) n=3 Tax=Saccharolobus solfataricus TaxID=2287 RepID=Q980W1_SACS2|nr:NAD-dependent epimerase/dehydratase family protein [Saccharolobus solfataricus]AAK40511.1 UDP-glucose 4-epimerase (galE-2) [Saccharolobus solfataricus P2]AZF67959.1 NAD-dependent epimerase/dehydratase family protein [Saccharolobus solfataricus]AZF70579.1 NAD-dependent epimerase/dehydratase family protein [Saccharolobus solfataricus]AZF73199.1 NAD-dependent epimerase/dehydratase family protein [Saccharolobus solfataricus]AZF75824.1 NAD-dependent epimerase/dehydratase family protein [Saccharo